MLELDDPVWSDLTHAHGSAGNIPDMLRQVEKDPGPKTSSRDEPWQSLWSSLCRHGEASDASFAAVPHLVRILESAPLAGDLVPVAWDLFALPAAIECARGNERAVLHPELEKSYLQALDRLLPAAARLKESPWDHVLTQSICAAIAAAQGALELAEALLELGPETTHRFLAREGLR